MEPSDYALSLSSCEPVRWKCLVGGNRRWKSGRAELELPGGGKLTAERLEKSDNAFVIEFAWTGTGGKSFGVVLDATGGIPLPPYLGRDAEEDDRRRYQTVFARREGSVAAPTAGLHFTPEVMDDLNNKDVDFRTLTLHVGAGTFKPVTSEELGGHVMHREFFSVSIGLLDRLIEQIEAGRPVVSIGTTSMRCLESLFYFGVKLLEGAELLTDLDQWVASSPAASRISTAPALRALKKHLVDGGKESFEGYTQLLLTPAVRPRVVDGLITNFHQPRSTLLLLVASVVGGDWRDIYDHALANDFRFLSYGDSSLLWCRRG